MFRFFFFSFFFFFFRIIKIVMVNASLVCSVGVIDLVGLIHCL